MPGSSHTPPSLCYSPTVSDSRRDSAPNTPLTTPSVEQAPWSPAPAPHRKERDLYFSWHRKPAAEKRCSNPLLGSDWHFAHHSEESLFEDDGDRDITFPLFPESPPRDLPDTMASAAPIDISLPPRMSSNSQSPRNQTSNLTFALQEAGATGQPAPEALNGRPAAAPETGRLSVSGIGRQDSMSNIFGSSYYNNATGAKPIYVKDRNRRESNTAGSFMNGMSWGGISVGSWVRDDIMMAGTSPAPYGRSPSLHSSSYLPKAEANFLKDYKCCGLTLDSLHELLQHFEENHAQPSNQIAHRASVSSQGGIPGARRPSTGMSAGETTRGFSGFDQQRPQQPVRPITSQPSGQQVKDGFSRTQLSTVQDVDSLDDMELDDSTSLFNTIPQHRSQTSQSNAGFNMNPTSSGNVPAQQAFRTSTPTTPSTGQPFAQFGNPTVSSVNTPALNTNDMQQAQGHLSPNQSIPGTPGDIDPNFANDFLGGGINFGALPQADSSMMTYDYTLGFGLENNLGDMTIDDPAKRLFSKQGGMNSNNQFQFGSKSGQMSMDSDLAKRLREQQLVGGLGGPIVGFPEPEHKPFRCPVIGCEKSYKNQNGLKYHKQHGHQNQQLQENEDGTYSIVDPTTSIPYPGTIGMEKEKPYRCETCGKRYKNLNGLKYHRQHSPPCNPELKQQLNPLAGLTPNHLHGLNPNANVAGAGLVGLPERMYS